MGDAGREGTGKVGEGNAIDDGAGVQRWGAGETASERVHRAERTCRRLATERRSCSVGGRHREVGTNRFGTEETVGCGSGERYGPLVGS